MSFSLTAEGATIKFEEASVRKFEERIGQWAELPGKTMQGAIRRTAVLFAKSARAATPQSPRYAKVIVNPKYAAIADKPWLRKNRKLLPYLAARQFPLDKTPRMVPVESPRAKGAKITTRGANKGAWSGVIRSLFRAGRGSEIGMKYGKAVINSRPGEEKATLTNRIYYGDVVDKRFFVMSTARQKAYNGLGHELRQLQNALNR